MSTRFVPRDFQPSLPLDRLVLSEAPSEEAVPMDVIFVGAGPAGLAGAIHLAQLVKQDNEGGGGLGEVEIAVLEKAEALGQHSLSGSVVNPKPFRELFPDLSDADFPFRGPVQKEAVYMLTENRSLRLPTPPTMHNRGNQVASICEIVQWLGAKAEGLGVNVLTGFPAASLLTDGQRLAGVRTTAMGLDRDGNHSGNYEPPTDITAKVTALAEGSRGMLAQAWAEWQSVRGPNPQIYALGVKELWETKTPLDAVIHTLGWPLPKDAFGGSFLYPLEPNLLALGLVVGLDYQDASLDVHELLQRMKLHPLFKRYLQGGQLVEWGAKTIPEGGYHALLERSTGDGAIVLGDSSGLVDVPSLKGIHYAMQSGIYAARTIFAALKADDTSAGKLAEYDRLLADSYVTKDLHRTRNMRLAFKDGFYAGGFKAAVMTATGGRLFGGAPKFDEDAAEPKSVGAVKPFSPDGELTFRKVDAVFKSGNATRDTIPSHVIAAADVPESVAQFYARMCPAEVYELVDGKLRINAPNCVDCKATDVLGPRWTPREGGSGPRYRRM
ncbi:MAG: electron-transfer flavoprotein:ubiquinone oxidoreductase [Planctomycetota bacterium]